MKTSLLKKVIFFTLAFLSYNLAFSQCTAEKDEAMNRYLRKTQTTDAQGCSQCAMLAMYLCSSDYCVKTDDVSKVGTLIQACKTNIYNMGQPYCCQDLLDRPIHWGSKAGGATTRNSSTTSTGTLTNPISSGTTSIDGTGQLVNAINILSSGSDNGANAFATGYTQGQQIIDAAKGLYTNPITNTSSGSNAVNSFNKGYVQGQQIADVAVALVDLLTPSPEQIKKTEEEKKIAQVEAAKKASKEKEMWEEYTKTKVLGKYIQDADRGDENARVILMFEMFRLSQITDITYLSPNLKNWIEEAVKNKNLDAMNFVGYHSIYNLKPFVNLNYTKEEGLKILEEAVTLNSADAMFTLGEYYNRKKMPLWLTTACKEGGNNSEKALYFFSKAAEHNLPDAKYILGKIYLNKCTVDKSSMYVTYKIEKNSNLGCTYIYNSLYTKDYQETLYQKLGIHFKKFIRHDVFGELSDMYENGKGCPKDKEMAKNLYNEIEKSRSVYYMKYIR
jgi:TPR repeat protein